MSKKTINGPAGHAYWRDEHGEVMAAPVFINGEIGFDNKGYVADCWDFDSATWAIEWFRMAEALTELVERCDGDAGVRADGSNIDTLAAHAALQVTAGI